MSEKKVAVKAKAKPAKNKLVEQLLKKPAAKKSGAKPISKALLRKIPTKLVSLAPAKSDSLISSMTQNLANAFS
jgi:hypothetical protein